MRSSPIDATSRWVHVAVTVGAGAVSLYANELKVGQKQFGAQRTPSMGTPVNVGCSADAKYFRRHIQDLRIWNCCRSTDEIVVNMSAIPDHTWIGRGLILAIELTNENSVRGPVMSSGLCSGVFSSLACEGIGWDPVAMNFRLPAGTVFGYRVAVRPSFSLHTLLTNPRYKADVETLLSQRSLGSLRHDAMIVRYVNEVSAKRNMSLEQILVVKWKDIAPNEKDLVRMPLLRVRSVCCVLHAII